MFELPRYLKERQMLVDTALDAALPPETTRPKELHKAMRYCIFTGGKRLRPILCLAAAECVGGRIEMAMPAAMAVELLHTYTLVHDDLPCMDDDNERRGKPTCHIAFGEANAVLTGDALQAEAFRILSETPHPCTGEMVHELSKAAGSQGVVGGQVEDIAAIGTTIEKEILEFVHQHKTADLFLAAIRMGVISARGKHHDLHAMTTYAGALGVAFQLVDDLLDADDATNAEPGTEELSALRLYSRDEVTAQARECITTAKAALSRFDSEAAAPLMAVADFVIERTY